MTLLDDLRSLLMKDERLVPEGNLLKNKIVELALKLDKDLLNLLLSNKEIKDHFFVDIDNALVFDKEKFMKFVDNKEFLPDSYTSFKNKIGLTVDKSYVIKNREVVLSWPYKDCILEGGQTKEDEKRDEIFHNEILAPDQIDRLLEQKVLTHFKRIDSKGEHKTMEIKRTDNLIIKGNNLLVLHSLKKRFSNQIKLIYIDPPYNTGNDEFNYNDNFNRSTWLTFMKNRLEVAKGLLRDDGVIFVQIDSREQADLKLLMDEIFDRNNFLSMITLKAKAGGGVGQESYLFDICEYILIYARDGSKAKNRVPFLEVELDDNVTGVYKKILYNSGSERQIKTIQSRNAGEIKVFEHKGFEVGNLNPEERDGANYYKYFDRIFRTTNPQGGLLNSIMPQLPDEGLVSIEYKPTKGRSAGNTYRYYFLDGDLIVWLRDSAVRKDKEKRVLKLIKNDNLWTENLHQGIAKEGSVQLKAGKKPEKLLKKILEMTTIEGDLVLDYHAGSGTTCAVAHKMGRQYIGVEQLDYENNDSTIRLKNVINGDTTGISGSVGWKGGGSFVYCELKQLNEDFVQKIKKAKDSKEVLQIWGQMKSHAFLSYRVDPKLFDDNIEEFMKLSTEDQKGLLVECLDANNLYVNYSEMNDSQYKVSEEDIELNHQIYGGF